MSIITNEDEARSWLVAQFGVSRETLDKLEQFSAMLLAENQQQNLISRSSEAMLWQRHIADSAQLLSLLDAQPTPDQLWLDLGSGAGFPGLIIAMLAPCRVLLVESRSKRIAWLQHCVQQLGLANVEVAGMRLEKLDRLKADYISARAFAALEKTLSLSAQFSTEKTHWLLPKGRNGKKELESLPQKWQSVFHVKSSLTDADAVILSGRGRISA